MQTRGSAGAAHSRGSGLAMGEWQVMHLTSGKQDAEGSWYLCFEPYLYQGPPLRALKAKALLSALR